MLRRDTGLPRQPRWSGPAFQSARTILKAPFAIHKCSRSYKQQSSICGRFDAAQSSVQDSAHSFGKQQHHPDIQISVERVKLAVSHALADTESRTHTKFVQGPRHSVHKGVRLFTCLPNVVQRATSRGSPRINPGM